MNATLLVLQGDVIEFYTLLNANFAGNVTDYMEASCRILRSVVGNRDIAMQIDGRLESIVELSRPRHAPQRFAEAYPFMKTRWIRIVAAKNFLPKSTSLSRTPTLNSFACGICSTSSRGGAYAPFNHHPFSQPAPSPL